MRLESHLFFFSGTSTSTSPHLSNRCCATLSSMQASSTSRHITCGRGWTQDYIPMFVKIHNLLRLWLRGRHAKDDYELSASSSSARVIASTGKRKSRSRAERREREQPQAKEGRKAYRYSTHFCSTLITSRTFPSLILFSRTSRLMLDDAACQLRGRHAHHARRQRTR